MPNSLVLSMPYFIRTLLMGIPILTLAGGEAMAQIAPGGMGPGPTQTKTDDKKEGVAEAAPKAPGLLPTTPTLPAPKSRRKRWKLFEIDGYFRMRTDWFK